MRILSINPQVEVELTEAEMVMKEWIDACINHGIAAPIAVEQICDMVPIPGTIWKLLSDPALTAYLTDDRKQLEHWYYVQSHAEADAAMGEPGCLASFIPHRTDPESEGTDCDNPDPNHSGPHEGPDPLDDSKRIRWDGGGFCAGDPLPYRNVQFIPAA